MTVKSLKHKFNSGISDGGDATQVRPSNWNADHDFYLGHNAQTGTSYTLADTDNFSFVTFNNGSATAVTLPQAGASSTFLQGWVIFVRNIGAGTVTVTPTTSTINGAATLAIPQKYYAIIESDGTNYHAIVTLDPSLLAAVATSGSASDLGTGTLPGGRMPALTGDVTMSSGTTATTLAAGSASNLNSGTLPAARMPAHTGDVTSSVGTVGLTLAAGSASNLNSGTLAIARGGTAQGTALAARGASGLNVESGTAHGNSDYTIVATDKWVYTNATFTAPRTWTLPLASALNAGQSLFIEDLQGTVTATNTLVVTRAGSDTINGGTSFTIDVANGRLILISDGTSAWSARLQRPFGTAAGNAIYLDSNAKIPAVDGSLVTALNATQLTSGAVPAARMPALTGDVTTSAGGVATTLAAGSASNLNSGTLAPARGGTGVSNNASSTITISGSFATTFTVTAACTFTFPPATSSLGYLNVPQNSQSGAYTTVLADSGKHLLHPTADTTARIFTIDSNANVAYAVGTVLTFINEVTAGTLTIAITSDTMRLAGAGTTGSRTLAANGIATAIKVTTTEWLISGTGLT